MPKLRPNVVLWVCPECGASDDENIHHDPACDFASNPEIACTCLKCDAHYVVKYKPESYTLYQTSKKER